MNSSVNCAMELAILYNLFAAGGTGLQLVVLTDEDTVLGDSKVLAASMKAKIADQVKREVTYGVARGQPALCHYWCFVMILNLKGLFHLSWVCMRVQVAQTALFKAAYDKCDLYLRSHFSETNSLQEIRERWVHDYEVAGSGTQSVRRMSTALLMAQDPAPGHPGRPTTSFENPMLEARAEEAGGAELVQSAM